MSFRDALAVHRQTALDGVRLLQEFDILDTESRRAAGKLSGTFPNVFFPDRKLRY
ncbi:hypothetical protein ACL02S_02780 [Nocardia sp. 004]|uniref:hypothetical protein n=1 Tax=Nocardia sp. 004 TaxID=3385978 RepID=UPI0039A31579